MTFRNACLAFSLLAASFSVSAAAPEPQDFTGYLFAYFEGTGEPADQEKIRFAYSRDGFNWYALNNNRPVTGQAWKISGTGGVRDPHIMRRVDGKGYYMVATDMLTKKNGWDSNPGITLLRSDDLQDWDHAVIDFAAQWPETFGNVKWVWAPQTIYDPEEGRYLVYFTIRFHDDENLDFYCAYANDDFTGFIEEPRLMFRAKYGAIDGDIIFKDGLYHFFYKGNTKDGKGNETKNGIKQATSRSLKGPWKETGRYVDAYADTPTMVEGSGIFKLNGSDEYILMYDLYTEGRYEFQRSTDLFTFTKTPESFTKNFMPRHGTVMPVTEKEARFLQLKFGGIPDSILSTPYSFVNEGNPLIRHKYTADPAPMVDGDTLWLYTGHDMHGAQNGYNMKDWCLFSTTDLVNWTEHPSPLDLAEFKWARSKDAYAAHAVKYNGRYWYFISTNGSGIGVAVADTPTGPFRDAIGKPLVTRADCAGATHGWACIDPAVFIDDDNTPWLFWGNRICYAARLKPSMTEIDGDIHVIGIDGYPAGRRFTEAPWVTKRNGLYYLTYASGWPEKISYATSAHILGPYEYRGVISETAPNSNTTHPGIVDFKGRTVFFTHDGTLVDGTSYSRSVVSEFLEYEPDGSIRFMPPTALGTAPAPEEPDPLASARRDHSRIAEPAGQAVSSHVFRSATPGEKLVQGFTGSRVTLTGRKAPGAGKALVSVIGSRGDTLWSSLADFSAPRPEDNAVILSTPPMPVQGCTLMVEVATPGEVAVADVFIHDIDVPEATFPDRDFPITGFGAVPERDDMRTVKANTRAIAAAIQACSDAGGGRVVVPAGDWHTGPVHFRSNVNLHLAEGSRLVFADDPKLCLPAVPTSWEGMECYNYSPLVYAYECSNIAITGPGTLAPKMDHWRKWFARPEKHMNALKELYTMMSEGVAVEKRQMAVGENNLRPHLVQFNRCSGILLDGFRIRESPFWTIHLYLCENAIARNLDVYAHGHNNDGIDIEMTRNVLVENCNFDQGDDGVVIKSGRNQDSWRIGQPTENVVVRNCNIANAHCLLGIGSEISGGIRNVYMHHCTVPESVFRLFFVKTNHRRGAFVEDIYMENVEGGHADTVFEIDTDVLYQWRKLVPTYETRLTRIDGVHLRNVSCKSANMMYRFVGDERLPIDNVSIHGLHVEKLKSEKNIVENVTSLDVVDTTFHEILPSEK